MDYKSVLNNCKNYIINDIRGDIYELFKSRQFISEDQFDLINDTKIPTSVIRNKIFFDILLSIIDQNVFEEFLLMLEENYWWIARALSQQADMNGERRVIEDNLQPDSRYHREMAEREESERLLREGGTPLYQLSSLYILRNDMSVKLTQGIQNLKPGMFLVLHGMSGSGKSSLAMKVLKENNLVANNLGGKIFWLFELKTIEQIHRRLLGLIGDGADFHGEIEPINCQAQISHIIKQRKFENALIVFDDIVKSDFIQYLNFNCKKLIITLDEGVVFSNPSNEVIRLKVDNFLTKKEALSLLGLASGMGMSNLPDEANEIILLTQGFPFLLHFIGRQIQQNEEASKNGLWKEITKILRRERRGKEIGPMDDCKEIGPMDDCLSRCYNVFDNYLEQLSTEKQHCYELFAVFPRDINLRAQVFTTIWSMNEISVINLLNEFENKSFIGKRPNLYSQGYVYGIHDVLYYYLKNRKGDHLKELHNELIDKYYAKCSGEFWNLKEDNYVHTYLGYHLKMSGRVELFNQFVNLLFVSATVKAAGATELLNNYAKYEDYIVTKDNEELFQELKEFVKHYGHILHQSDDINIIQLGLQQKEKSAIYKSARALAQKQPDKIFLNFQPKHRLVDSNSDSRSFKIPEQVNAACFSDQFNYVFLANSNGSITKKSLGNSRNAPLTGHKASVVFLTLSQDKRYLLSVSKDLEIRVWDMLEINNDRRFNFNGTLKNGDQSPSPPLRQHDHSPIFDNGLLNLKSDYCVQGSDVHKRPLTCIKFSPNSKYIFSCSEENNITMWNFEKIPEDILLRTWSTHISSVPRCCTFSLDGRSVLVGCDNKTLVSILVEHCSRRKVFKFDSSIKCLHTIKGVNGTHPPTDDHSNFVLVLSNKVQVIQIKNSYIQEYGPMYSNDQNYEVLCSWNYEKSQESFITRSWVPDNGAFIALTTSRHRVSLFNLANGHLQRQYTYESTQEVMGFDLFLDEKIDHMLVLCRNETLHVEKLELSPNEQASKFCVAPNWGDEEVPTVVVPCINGFKVVKGERDFPFYLKTNVTSCHIANNASLVAIGTDCGTVLLFDLNTSDQKTSLEFKDSNRNPSLVVLVRVFSIENETLVVGIDNKHLVKISYKANVIEYQAESKVKGVWYSPHLKELILVAQNQKIKIWKIANSLVPVNYWSHNNESDGGDNKLILLVRCCDMSCTNNLAIATSKTVKMLNLVDKDEKKLSFDQAVDCCGFSPDGECIAFGFADGTIQVYNVELQLMRETSVKWAVKAVCIGNGANVFGALSTKRIHLGRLYGDNYRIGCTELAAKQLIKAAANYDCFLTVDKRSQIYKVTIFNFFDLSEPLSAININPPPSSRPRLIIKRNPHLYY